ncbi:WAT1-related protein [Panicum miliaceum]|uniref:WAT1-related protein n=1 Tax=Panicum miliaceum TaxID=4540 RepID=A0A3L6Q0H7_PANMI|nr:WAT1-related protein [Panicum miliaceum]
MAGSGDLLPVVGMVSFQVVFAGLNLFYKLAVSDGMDLRVLVAYRYMFASAFNAPLAYFVERKNRTELTRRVLVLSFMCGLTGWAPDQISSAAHSTDNAISSIWGVSCNAMQ